MFCFFFFVLSLVPLAPEPADFVWPAAVRGPVLSSAGALSNLRVSWLVRGDAVVDRLHIRDPTLGAAVIGRLRTLVRLTIVEIFRLPHVDFDEYSRRLLSDLEAVLLSPSFLTFLHSCPTLALLGRRLESDSASGLAEGQVAFGILGLTARSFASSTPEWRRRHSCYIVADGFVATSDLERVPPSSAPLGHSLDDRASILNRFHDWVRFRCLPRRVHFGDVSSQTSEDELERYIFHAPGRFPAFPLLSDRHLCALRFWLVVWWRVSSFERYSISECMRWLDHDRRNAYYRGAFLAACAYGPAAWSFSHPLSFAVETGMGELSGWEWGSLPEPDLYWSRIHMRYLPSLSLPRGCGRPALFPQPRDFIP